MRWLHFFVVPLLFLVGQTNTLSAQSKKSPESQVTQIAGHTLDHWIGLVPSKDQSQSETAMRMIVLFGPEQAYQAVPAILSRLRKHTPAAPVDASVRVNGAIALGFILGGYHEADPKLAREAVMILKRFLADNQSIVRYRAAQALGRIGTAAHEAIPEMISVVKDSSTYETRQAATIALGLIAQDKKGPTLSVLRALFGALGDNSMQVRLAAIQSLTFLGPPNSNPLRIDMIRALEPIAHKDPEANIRIWAHMAIMNIAKNIDKDRVDVITHMLSNPEMVVRMAAAQSLGTLAKAAKSAVPELIKTVSDPEPMVGAWAIWALGRMETAASAALPILETIKGDKNQPEIMRNLAKDAVDSINGKKK